MPRDPQQQAASNPCPGKAARLTRVFPPAGLAAVGVALVAVAAKGLVNKAIKGPLTSAILLLSACISFVYSAPWLFPALILAGGCVTLAVHTVQGRRMALAVRRSSAGSPRPRSSQPWHVQALCAARPRDSLV